MLVLLKISRRPATAITASLSIVMYTNSSIALVSRMVSESVLTKKLTPVLLEIRYAV